MSSTEPPQPPDPANLPPPGPDGPVAQPPPPAPGVAPQAPPQQAPQPAARPMANPGLQGGPPPGGTGWYNGPLPIASLAPRETFWSAVGRTLVKSIVVLGVVLFGLFMIPVTLIAIGAALGGGGDTELAGTPRTLVAGEARADVRLVAIPITGIILGEDRGQGGGGLFGAIDATYGYTIKEELAELADDPDHRALDLANRLAAFDPAVVKAIRRSVKSAVDQPLEAGLALERRLAEAVDRTT